MKRKKGRMAEMLAAFRERYEQGCPFHEDRALGADLVEQARPVLEALSEPAPEAGSDPDHEALALLTLLSRHAGLLGATPAITLALYDAIDAGLKAGECVLAADAHAQLKLVIVEGYAAGRDERLTREARQAAVAALRLVPLTPHAFALIAAGKLSADELGAHLEELERQLLRADARALVLDVTTLRYDGDEVPRLFCGLLATARTLGVRVFMCGLDADTMTPWLQAGFSHEVERTSSFDHALTRALLTVDVELKPRRRWPGPLFRRRASDRERDPV